MTDNLPIINVQNLTFDRVQSHVGLITPESASYLLGRNIQDNRNINETRVRYWASLMEYGEWGLSEPLKMDTNGQLFDGQHRLKAVEKVGIPVPFVLITGYPPKSAQLVDQGVKRTAQHIAKLQGLALSQNHLSLARYMIHANSGSLKDSVNISPQLIVFAAKKHKEVLDFCVSRSHVVGQGFNVAPVLAVVGSAYFHENHKRLGEFLDCWRSGMVINGASDNAALKLRSDYTLHPSKYQGGTMRASLFYKSQTAVKHFLNRKSSLSHLRETSDILWPVPELNLKFLKEEMKNAES